MYRIICEVYLEKCMCTVYNIKGASVVHRVQLCTILIHLHTHDIMAEDIMAYFIGLQL